MILPRAVATMSIVPKKAQPSANKKRPMIVVPIARPIGDGGVSTISSAAGKKASSCSRRRTLTPGRAIMALRELMDPGLQAVQVRIAPAGSHELFMRAVLDEPASLDRDDAVGSTNGRQSVSDDQDGAPAGYFSHVFMDDPLARVVQRACRLVED